MIRYSLMYPDIRSCCPSIDCTLSIRFVPSIASIQLPTCPCVHPSFSICSFSPLHSVHSVHAVNSIYSFLLHSVALSRSFLLQVGLHLWIPSKNHRFLHKGGRGSFGREATRNLRHFSPSSTPKPIFVCFSMVFGFGSGARGSGFSWLYISLSPLKPGPGCPT